MKNNIFTILFYLFFVFITLTIVDAYSIPVPPTNNNRFIWLDKSSFVDKNEIIYGVEITDANNKKSSRFLTREGTYIYTESLLDEVFKKLK